MISKKEELLLVKKHNHLKMNSLVKKDNNRMDIVDYKIMSIAIAKINNNLKLSEVKIEDCEIEITKEELLWYLKTKDINITKFKQRISNLLKKQVDHTTDLETKKPKFNLINIFTSGKYDGEKLVLKINIDLMNFFVELKSNFTQYYYKNLIDFGSIYSIMVYEILKHNEYKFKKINYIEYTIEELFKIFELKTKRTMDYGFIREKIIKVSQKEINKYSDIKFDYKPVKDGNKVVKIQFYLLNDKPIDVSSKEDVSKIIENLSSEEILEIIAKKDDCFISKILKNYQQTTDENFKLKIINEKLIDELVYINESTDIEDSEIIELPINKLIQ